MAIDFDLPQFSTQELLACSPGLSHDTFKQWLKRRAVSLSVGEEIGRGRRPMYRGHDVAQVALRYELSNFGIFSNKFVFVWQIVQGRLIARHTGLANFNPGPISAFFHIHPDSGELMFLQFSEASGEGSDAIDEKSIPDVHLLIRIDRFIDRLVERMERVKAGLPAKEPIKRIEAENWSGDFSVDADGNRVLIGLTRAESEEYVSLMEFVAENRASEAQSNRYAELDSKHAYAKAWREVSRRPKTDEDDIMRAWSTDDHGARVMAGLTNEETEEFIRLSARDLAHRMSDNCFPWSSVPEKSAELRRLVELQDKHEVARIARVAKEHARRSSDTS
jgi:hypothetical protein